MAFVIVKGAKKTIFENNQQIAAETFSVKDVVIVGKVKRVVAEFE